jgi:hypothetical protein
VELNVPAATFVRGWRISLQAYDTRQTDLEEEMTTQERHHTPWYLWPFVAIWKLLAVIVEMTGRLVAMILGIVLMIVGVLISLTIVGAIVGVPLAIVGLLLFVKGIF